MIEPRHITAALVTRGDQPEQMARIIDSLIFDKIMVWDNSRYPDWKCAGRYWAALYSRTELVYYQDDDVLVPRETQEALVDAWNASDMSIVANWGHGENPDGYDDLPLVCGGAITNRGDSWNGIARYGAQHPLDEAFMYEADFVVGVLYDGFEHVHLPFDINMPIAQAPERLCNQPWQKDLKLEVTNRARAIRDALVPA